MLSNAQNNLLTIIFGFASWFFLFFSLSELPESPVVRNHNNLTSVAVAMSLASHTDEIYEILGGPEYEEFMEYIEKLKSYSINHLIFVVFFVPFLIQMIIHSTKGSPFKLITYILIFSISLSGVASLLENLQLQKVLDSSSTQKMEKFLFWMNYFSHLKWFLFFGVIAGISMGFWLNEKALLLKASSVFLLSGFLFYIFSLVKLNLIELGILFSFLGSGIYWIYSLLKLFLSKKI